MVDDEPRIRRIMRTTLTAAGYEIDDAKTGEEALEKLRAFRPDLILLDVNMPGMSGLEACRAIRADSEVAVIMLTVRNSERDKVDALDAGADDFVTKPFSTPELMAPNSRGAAPCAGGALRVGAAPCGPLLIDFGARTVSNAVRTAHLTPKELDLLRYLTQHTNEVVPHRQLLQAVWGPDYGDQVEYLRVFIKNLRRKIEANPDDPQVITTEPWIGYRFNAAAPHSESPRRLWNLYGFSMTSSWVRFYLRRWKEATHAIRSWKRQSPAARHGDPDRRIIRRHLHAPECTPSPPLRMAGALARGGCPGITLLARRSCPFRCRWPIRRSPSISTSGSFRHRRRVAAWTRPSPSISAGTARALVSMLTAALRGRSSAGAAWWRRRKIRLARDLRRAGHEVIVVSRSNYAGHCLRCIRLFRCCRLGIYQGLRQALERYQWTMSLPVLYPPGCSSTCSMRCCVRSGSE